jgi:ubiquinol-cytochrome c reductase cytochrome c1 subunit
MKILKGKKMRKALLTGGMLLAMALPFGQAQAAGDAIEYPQRVWSFDGMTGTFDRAQLQRGFQVYREVCSACHGLERVYYRNLGELGYSEAQVKAVASDYTVEDGPNDEGEMFTRPARPSDNFVGPYPNEQAARSVNNGAYPLDLSLIVKARADGTNYIAALLTGYKDAPADMEMMPGMHYNKYFSGHQIAMAKPISDGQISYADGTEATVEQMATDVAAFLTWASEPTMEARKKMGVKVLIFLTILAFIMYRVKRKVWSDVEH